MTLAWLGTQFNPQAPGFWLLVSFLISALLASVRDLISPRWRQPLWLANWLLIPYLGLLLGGLSPRLMGLTRIDWLASLGLGLGLSFAVLVLLVLVRATVDLADSASPAASPAPAQPETQVSGWHLVSDVLLLSGGMEFHWAFLRGALWEILLVAPEPLDLPGYWAIWGAALIATVEILAARPGFVQWLLLMATLVTTSILFFYTRNFWLCWILHTTIQVIGSPSTHLPRRWADLLVNPRR